MAQNPFRSEADAYRFLLLTIGYFALIVAASFIDRWLGLAVFIALTAFAVWRWAKSRSTEPPERVVMRGELGEEGVDARGEVGDGDPLQAMEDALRTFGAHEIVISTHPEGRSHWLERNVVSAARERFEAPITHVVVDLEAEADRVVAEAE